MIKLNMGFGIHPLKGFINLDLPTINWNAPLPIKTRSVDAITISHSLCYSKDIYYSFTEIYRILKIGGIVRITEDNAESKESKRYGGYPDAISITGPGITACQLGEAGFIVFHCKHNTTYFKDLSLCQVLHFLNLTLFF